MSEQMLKKIEELLEGVSLKTLLSSAQKISNEYRTYGKRNSCAQAQVDPDLWAYLVVRMPATYAALCRVFQELKRYFPDFTPETLLDIGAGPATSLWAADNFFPKMQKLYFLEKEMQFISIGKHLAENLALCLRSEWICADMKNATFPPPCDLVIASYCLGEIEEAKRTAIAEKIWDATKKICIIIEPGTPNGFKGLREIRKQLLSSGAHLIAPCPHSAACPMADDDWCHFYVRLNRSSLHRKMKEAELNYEDEKFSYLIFSKEPAKACQSRILRHPYKGKGHVKLQLCTQDGLKERIVTKKERLLYPFLKKSHWGDAVD